jgi:very-short-patch-repair endonuclease
MDPAKITSGTGVDLLRQYLQYVGSGGRDLGDVLIEKPELNPFEIDVRDTLTALGLRLIPQYGSSGYRIDFAVQHPEQPGRFVLAIECDGASYHSCHSARDRDRLRQDQLERLGWRFHRIWSSDWFYNREAAAAKAVDAYKNALRGLDSMEPEQPVVQEWATTTGTRGPRPYIRRGADIAEYSQSELVRLAQWLESDGRLRTEEELVGEMMSDLGFHRRGSRIVAEITTAIRHARA